MGNQHITVRTRGVVFDEDGKVLVQHHSDYKPDFYRLPGGGIKFREKAEDCIVREIKEETGLDVKAERLLWIRDFLERSHYHSVELFFLTTIKGGEFNASSEGKQMEFSFMAIEELERHTFYPKAFIPKLKLLRDNRDWTEENPYIRSAN